jgi:hypothetical protein
MSITVEIVEANAEINVQVDNLRVLKVNRKTEAQLVAQAASGGLIADELYFITDTNKIAYALTASTFAYIEAVAAASWGFISGTLANQTDLQSALNGKANTVHTHTASQVTDFQTTVSANADVAANTAARHAAVTVTDSSEIDFTLTGQALTGSLKDGSIARSRLADVGAQKLIGRHANNSGTPQEVGLDGGLEFQGANIRRAALTGDITAPAGSNTTTLPAATISGKPSKSPLAGTEELLINDAGTVRKTTATAIAALASVGATTWGSITGTLADQTDLDNALTGLANAIGAKLEPGDNVSALTNDAGYLTSESDPVFGASEAASFASGDRAKIIKRSIYLNIDGGGSAITTGIVADVIVPFGMTITGWTIISDQTGSIVVDVWRDSYANYPPDVADTIAGTEKPTLSSASKNQDNTLSSWTTSITAGDILRFNVDSAATVQRVTLIIEGVLS